MEEVIDYKTHVDRWIRNYAAALGISIGRDANGLAVLLNRDGTPVDRITSAVIAAAANEAAQGRERMADMLINNYRQTGVANLPEPEFDIMRESRDIEQEEYAFATNPIREWINEAPAAYRMVGDIVTGDPSYGEPEFRAPGREPLHIYEGIFRDPRALQRETEAERRARDRWERQQAEHYARTGRRFEPREQPELRDPALQPPQWQPTPGRLERLKNWAMEHPMQTIGALLAAGISFAQYAGPVAETIHEKSQDVILQSNILKFRDWLAGREIKVPEIKKVDVTEDEDEDEGRTPEEEAEMQQLRQELNKKQVAAEEEAKAYIKESEKEAAKEAAKPTIADTIDKILQGEPQPEVNQPEPEKTGLGVIPILAEYEKDRAELVKGGVFDELKKAVYEDYEAICKECNGDSKMVIKVETEKPELFDKLLKSLKDLEMQKAKISVVQGEGSINVLIDDTPVPKEGGEKGEKKKKRAKNPWVAHVNAYAKKHKMSYFEALGPAKASYDGGMHPGIKKI